MSGLHIQKNENVSYAVLKTLGCFLAIFFILFFVKTAEAGTATLKIDPPQGTFVVGSSFDVSIILDTGGETINAVEAELRFPPNVLQVTSPSAARSFIAIWTSPPTYSNQEGFVKFQGGVPAPGIKTSQGVLSTITFRATQPGNVVLELKDARVLLADGSGTNIFSSALGARYSIKIPPPQGPVAYSPTHPEPGKWYRDKNVTFVWDKGEGVSEFSWSVDAIPNSAPDTVSDGDKTSVSFSDLTDGLWYFHIRAKQGDTWGGVTTFPVKIDTAPPAQFSIVLDPKDRVTTKTRVLAIFSTTDVLSGVDRYEVSVVNVSGPNITQSTTFFIEGESPFTLPDLSVGTYHVVVRAHDLAGNFQESSATLYMRESAFPLFLTRGFYIGVTVLAWPLAIIVSFGLTVAVGLWARHFWKRHRHVRMETSRNVGGLRDRLREEIILMQKKVAEDTTLRERMAKQLRHIEKLATSGKGEKDQELPEDEERRKDKSLSNPGLKFIFLGILMSSLLSFTLTAYAQALLDTDMLFPPQILIYDLEIATNQLLYLRGVAPEGSVVELTIRGDNQQPIQEEVRVNEDGSWEHIQDLYFSPGFYKISARSKTPEGSISRESDAVEFRVVTNTNGKGEKGRSTELIFGILVLGLVFLDVVFLGILVYFWQVSKVLRRDLRKEVFEVHRVLEEGFPALRSDIEEEFGLLEKNGKNGVDSTTLAEDEERKTTLLEDMERVEKSLRKEISDLERFL